MLQDLFTKTVLCMYVVVADGVFGVLCCALSSLEISSIQGWAFSYFVMALDLEKVEAFQLENVSHFCVLLPTLFSFGIPKKGGQHTFTIVESSWKLFCQDKFLNRINML
jgi:hypothetical protein